jgi:hypothetical protein
MSILRTTRRRYVPLRRAGTGTVTGRLLGTATAIALAGAFAAAGTVGTAQAATTVYNVKSYGATGNGTTIDTPAINDAIAAASKAGGGEVYFPAGTYESVSIHLKSNVEIYLDSGATIRAAASGFDAPESNPYSQYQDFGHSYFHDSLIWGDSLTDVSFAGSGTIDGDGHLHTGTTPSGEADKAIAITRSSNIGFSGITVKNGGWIAVLTNGVDHLSIDGLNVQTASDRDGPRPGRLLPDAAQRRPRFGRHDRPADRLHQLRAQGPGHPAVLRLVDARRLRDHLRLGHGEVRRRRRPAGLHHHRRRDREAGRRDRAARLRLAVRRRVPVLDRVVGQRLEDHGRRVAEGSEQLTADQAG